MTTIARYDAIADFYKQFAPDIYSNPPFPDFFALIGQVSGLRVLNLTCGHGRVTRELARRGARVVGVDISAALLERAQVHQQIEPLSVSYIHADAISPNTRIGEQFDAVTCYFGLSDIDDLDGAAATVARLVRVDGSFTFLIVHPCFPGWKTKQANASWQTKQGYFAERWWRASGPAHDLRARVGENHRMLST